MAAVQFYGKENVIEAFQNRSVEAWAIYQHKELLTKGIGQSDFEAFIEILCKGSTNAIYTVRVYEDIEDPKLIKSNTPNDGGFNFRLNSEEQMITGSQYSRMGSMNQLLSEVSALRKEVQELKEEEEEDDDDNEKPHNLGMMGDILAHPAIKPIVPVLVQQILANFLPGYAQPQPQAPSALGDITADEESKLMQGIQRLRLHDSKLGTHILKLADIAEKDKPSFNTLVQMLDAINL
jgi:hypothetical protein